MFVENKKTWLELSSKLLGKVSGDGRDEIRLVMSLYLLKMADGYVGFLHSSCYFKSQDLTISQQEFIL